MIHWRLTTATLLPRLTSLLRTSTLALAFTVAFAANSEELPKTESNRFDLNRRLAEARVLILKRNYPAAVTALSEIKPSLTKPTEIEEVTLLLAQSHEALKHPANALQLYREYLKLVKTNTVESIDALLSVGDLEQLLNRSAESSVSYREVLQRKDTRSIQTARALLGLSENEYAQKKYATADAYLESALSYFSMSEDWSPHRLEALKLQYFLRANECDQFPSQPDLKEAQWLDQMERKSTCLLKCASIIQKIERMMSEDENTLRAEAFSSISLPSTKAPTQATASSQTEPTSVLFPTQQLASQVRSHFEAKIVAYKETEKSLKTDLIVKFQEILTRTIELKKLILNSQSTMQENSDQSPESIETDSKS